MEFRRRQYDGVDAVVFNNGNVTGLGPVTFCFANGGETKSGQQQRQRQLQRLNISPNLSLQRAQ